MIIAPTANPVTDIVRIDVLERNEDGSVKTAQIVEIDEVVLLQKTGETEPYWERGVASGE
jgi:hypothetical protein